MQKIIFILMITVGVIANAQTPTPSPTPNKYCTLNLPSAAYQTWKAAHCH